MHRKMQNKMKMIYFRSVNNNKDLYSAKKGEVHQTVSCRTVHTYHHL